MKKLFAAAAFLAVLAVGWYFFTDGTMSMKGAKKKLVREARDAALEHAAPEEVAALAMKAMNLTQGEHGAELWRLKADWGNMRRSDQILELEKPRFTYYMPPEHIELTIVSDKGEIDENEQKIRFVTNVVATYRDRRITAPSLVYFGKSREVVCPEGAEMTGAGMEGTANRVVWRLRDKVLEGLGDVDMTFENDKDIFSPEGRENENSAPKGAQG